MEVHNLQVIIYLQSMEFIAEKYCLILFGSLTGDTPQRLRLSKVLVVQYHTTVQAYWRMALCGVDAVLLADSNALLCEICCPS